MINTLSHIFARLIHAISEAGRSFLENLNVSQYSAMQVFFDILLVSILFYWLIMLIRGTRATNIVLGLFILAFLFAISRFFQLLALGFFLDRIFTQELRRGLEKLGKTKFFLAQEAKEIDFIRSELIESFFGMAKKKLGALIVFRGDVKLKEYIDTGVVISGRISKELILALFSKESPLHDGAVIIDQYRMIAGGCILPHSFKEYGHKFGTRHKAALGLSEATDAAVFVVSEERGTVSYVADGEIEPDITPERAQAILTHILAPKKLFHRKHNSHHHAQKSTS